MNVVLAGNWLGRGATGGYVTTPAGRSIAGITPQGHSSRLLVPIAKLRATA